MNIYAVICTRSADKYTKTTEKLLRYYTEAGIKVVLLANQSSIFSAYNRALEKIKPKPEDIVIFCHDDIVIRDSESEFVQMLQDELTDSSVGFVGPAGTTYLTRNAVWWNQDIWRMGRHRGCVYHLNGQGREYKTFYGDPGPVAVLDGLFLAAKGSTIEDISFEKPEYFEGDWDFYDIHYTTQAHLKGYTNKVVKMNILHNSAGELAGRDSWHKNREAYIQNTDLPLIIEM